MGPLVAVVGDLSPGRQLDPPMRDAAAAREAAVALGTELARRGARLLVYGGPYLETDVVRGFVAGEPKDDRSIVMWYSQEYVPPPFAEQKTHPNLFDQRVERGKDWEIAFYRSITRADALILMGGGNATMIAGQVAIGTRMPILALPTFGGAASKVWTTLSAGEDLPNRSEIEVMAKPWGDDSARACVDALLAQQARRASVTAAPSTTTMLVIAGLFAAALALLPLVWGGNDFKVWMLFLAPLLAGAAGAPMRQIVFRTQPVSPLHVSLIIGLVAGGIATVLFVTAQLTADPALATGANAADYARRTIPWAVGIGFIAGFTSDAVFGKLVSQDVVQVSGIRAAQPRP